MRLAKAATDEKNTKTTKTKMSCCDLIFSTEIIDKFNFQPKLIASKFIQSQRGWYFRLINIKMANGIKV
jgi:hypothetical protein